ncbi:SGNH/GDSL hydrolase family protein [Mycobacterium sp. 663a-19]|uniref:SGNH/GDSL hydrolase family protein n=1 Tax=Mycobacterium sp. 663a-19 TaxID=2986148 RepID=UPI002D1E60F7|nr:SGNH/GDSL hydrolase family protein [Mycobacterium sp. 663a-19]MEB3980334.1 SGNH/GDSL hydrolase family protein [Mycobacterium sp. 663a-19]
MSPPKAPTSARRAILLAVAATLALSLGVLTYRELHAAGRSESRGRSSDIGAWVSPPSPSTMFDYKPTLLAVGDWSTPFIPYLVTETLGWKLVLAAQGGTGFIRGTDNPSPLRVPFIDGLDQDAATYYVDHVLIDGGRNDIGEPPERVTAAADEYLKKVHSVWPYAKLIVVLPAPVAPEVAPNYPAVADGLRQAAGSLGAYVIDPVAQQWYLGVDMKPLLSPDGLHLNDNGEVYYASKIVASLRQLGLTP